MFAMSVVSFALLVPMACVQEDVSEDEIDQARRTAIIKREVKEEYQALILNHMKLHIRQLQQFLDLDAKSVRRLEIASKGATKKVVERYGQKVAERAEQNADAPTISLNGRMLKLQEDDAGEDEANADPPRSAALRMIINVRSTGVSFNCKTENGSTGYGMGGGYSYAFKQDVWKDSLAAVATKEQLKAFDEHKAKRRRASAVDLLVAVLTLDLELEDSQVGPIREWISGQIKAVAETDLQSGARWSIATIGRKLKPLGAEKILTDAQQSILRSKLADWEQ